MRQRKILTNLEDYLNIQEALGLGLMAPASPDNVVVRDLDGRKIDSVALLWPDVETDVGELPITVLTPEQQLELDMLVEEKKEV